MGEALQIAGYELVTARNGVEALAQLQQGPLPALILLDLNMPVMGGAELMRQQQKQPRLAQIPVILLSAEHNLVDAARSLGAVEGLRKPAELGSLLALVKRHTSVLGP